MSHKEVINRSKERKISKEFVIICVAAVLVLALVVSLALSLHSCGDKDDSSSLPVSADVAADSTEDPENTDNGAEDGPGVKAENLSHAEGKQNGIDVSKWQGKINWKSVADGGIEFAVIRIGFRGENGIIYKDDAADYNIQQAQKAGVLVGVYFFSTAVSAAEAREEAEWTVSAIKGYSVSYPVVYDCEGYNSADSRMNGMDSAGRTACAKQFLSVVTAAGYEGMLYASSSELSGGAFNLNSLSSSVKIWIAQYPDVAYPQTPAPFYDGRYDMWQHTNRGSVPGITGNTDLVVSYFTRQKADPKDKSATVAAASAPLVSDGIYSAASDRVTAKEETNLRDAATVKSNVVVTLKNGEFVERTGIGSNGWSRLLYNGKTVYAITSYMTTDANYIPAVTSSAPPVDDGFTAVSDRVTAKDATNLRSVPSSKDDSTIVYTLKNGEFVDRTGTGKNGWSRLLYNGQTVYAVTSFLTTEVRTPSSSEPVSSESGVSITFAETSEQVTAIDETNLRSTPSSKDDSTIVYTLKNGEYVTRTGISDRGWSRLDYNGQTVYAISSYLKNKQLVLSKRLLFKKLTLQKTKHPPEFT